jgi:hypothetical protein
MSHKMRDSELRANTYKLGRAAIKRLEKDKTRYDWLQVGDAFLEARAEAMEELGLTGTNLRNHRLGGGYYKAFGDILKREHLESSVIDATTRNQLFTIMDNRPAIEAALQLLDRHERARLNHPSTIMRFWKRTGVGQDTERKQRRSPARDTSNELAAALQHIEELKAHNQELEAAREAARETASADGESFDELKPRIIVALNKMRAGERDDALAALVKPFGLSISARLIIGSAKAKKPKAKGR